MQNKHTLIYFLGRGLPGLLSFVAITVYTRLVLPEEYGKYALVMATVSLMNMVLFQWIRLSLLRYLPKCETSKDFGNLYSSLAFGFFISSLISAALLGIYIAIKQPEAALCKLFTLGLVLLWFEAFFELNLEYFRSTLKPVVYSIAFFVKSLVALGVGVLFALLNLGAFGIITGIIVADLIAVAIFCLNFSASLLSNNRYFSFQFYKTLFLYGLPLTASFAMSFVINSSSRFFIDHYLGKAATGQYSVAYDFSNNSLTVIMYAINLASFPLAIRALEKGGVEAASSQLKKNLILLLGISTPTAITMAALSDRVSSIFMGHSYVQVAAQIIPFISIGGLVVGFKNYYLDLAFQLGNKTYLQVWTMIVPAISNVVFNILWIPRYGVYGAVYSTLLSYVLSLVLSYYLSEKSFKMPTPWLKMLIIYGSAAVMGILLLVTKRFFSGFIGLVLNVSLGGITYILLLSLFGIIDVTSLRKRMSTN